MNIFLPALSQSLLFFPLVLSVYLSYCILQITDLTVDGSFVMGAAVFARFITLGFSPLISFVFAILAGAFIGVGVSLIQFKNRIEPLLASILALFMLYSLNTDVMGKPNVNLLDQPTLATLFHTDNVTAVIAIIVVLLTLGLFFLLKSQVGLRFRAFGSNNRLLKRLGYRTELIRLSCLSLSNALAALGGALAAQMNGYADINMGFGMALTAIGAVVLGKHLFSSFFKNQSFSLSRDLTSCALGTLFYFLAINLFLAFGLNPIHLKLVLGLLLVFFLKLRKPAHE